MHAASHLPLPPAFSLRPQKKKNVIASGFTQRRLICVSIAAWASCSVSLQTQSCNNATPRLTILPVGDDPGQASASLLLEVVRGFIHSAVMRRHCILAGIV